VIDRRNVLLGTAAMLACPRVSRAASADGAKTPLGWYRLVLQLVRHTATYSPPVAARTFGCLGVGLWETVAAARGLPTLAGQLQAFDSTLSGPTSLVLDAALHGAMAEGVRTFFGNTGPSGQQAIRLTEQRLRAQLDHPDPASFAFGAEMMKHVVAWAASDGGSVIVNLGFPDAAQQPAGPAAWTPTSSIRIQQAPLLPKWGDNRPMALDSSDNFMPEPPYEYSEDVSSQFYADANEVYAISRDLTAEQKLIARYWSDDPMLTFTPPGHWLSILLQLAEKRQMPVERLADALARVGISQNDAFIVCWRAKFKYNLLRPVTYIRRCIDPNWTPLLTTPPFPEYTSGHSSQSAAAAEVLSRLLGADLPFDDATAVREGLPVRSFPNFRAAAEEAALSRLYGGIHFRHANEQGLAQGRKVGAAVAGLITL